MNAPIEPPRHERRADVRQPVRDVVFDELPDSEQEEAGRSDAADPLLE